MCLHQNEFHHREPDLMLTHGTWVTSDNELLQPHWWHLARWPGQPLASAACEETEQSDTRSEKRHCRQESCRAVGCPGRLWCAGRGRVWAPGSKLGCLTPQIATFCISITPLALLYHSANRRNIYLVFSSCS